MDHKILFFLASVFILLPLAAFAQTTVQVDFTNVPDIASPQGTGGAGFIGWIQSFYQFSLIAGVFLAVGVIAWAGLRYALAAGNPSGQSDARDQILQALLGLILLFGAYLILYTINPNLINLSLPTLSSVSVSAPASNVGGGPAYVDLPPEIAAEIDANVIFTGLYDTTISGRENMVILADACAYYTSSTGGNGVVVPKYPQGGGATYYVCETPR